VIDVTSISTEELLALRDDLLKASGLTFADQARAILRRGYAAAYIAGKKDAKKAIPKPVAVPYVDPADADAAPGAEAPLPGDVQPLPAEEGIDSSEINSDDETLGDSSPSFDENTDEGDDSDITDEWDDTGDDDLDDDGEAAVDGASDRTEDALMGFGALLVGTVASTRQLDAWLSNYAAGLNPLYEQGFEGGVPDAPDGMVTVATWVTEEDGVVCEMCDARDGMTWVGNEIDVAMPFPGEGGFGGSPGRGDIAVCLGGPRCRCSIDYSYVTQEEAAAMQAESPYPDDSPDVSAFSTADLLKVWTILKYSDDEARDDMGAGRAEAEAPS
jgi:hypothetical protein